MRDPRRLHHLSTADVAALPKDPGVLLLPLGAIEQHGPHLPLATDLMIASAMVDEGLRALSTDVAAWTLPPLPFSKSTEHLAFPGTIALSTATLHAVLMEVAASVARAGFRRLAFVNGHGGNLGVLPNVMRDAREKHGLLCFLVHAGAMVDDEDPLDDRERRLGIHAGQWETSLILALDESLVDLSQAVAEHPPLPETPFGLTGPVSIGWLAQDWSATGTYGDPNRATGDHGRASLARIGRRMARLIADMSTFPLPGTRRT